MEIKKVGVIGAGVMGNGIAHVFAQTGYDVVLAEANIQLAEKGSKDLAIPTIICGGCKNLEDIRSLLTTTEASAAAVGSLFVFKGPHKGVLISYPSPEEIEAIYN